MGPERSRATATEVRDQVGDELGPERRPPVKRDRRSTDESRRILGRPVAERSAPPAGSTSSLRLGMFQPLVDQLAEVDGQAAGATTADEVLGIAHGRVHL